MFCFPVSLSNSCGIAGNSSDCMDNYGLLEIMFFIFVHQSVIWYQNVDDLIKRYVLLRKQFIREVNADEM